MNKQTNKLKKNTEVYFAAVKHSGNIIVPEYGRYTANFPI